MSVDPFIYPPELLRFLTSKAGIRRAFKVMEFLMLWGILADELEREPNRFEFEERWDESEPTYYRRLEVWRSVWPDDANPQRVWDWHKAEAAAKVSPRTATA